MKRVRVSRYGIVHYLAICQDCDFSNADHADRERLRRQVRKHVVETGHTVTIEAGSATHYALYELQEVNTKLAG